VGVSNESGNQNDSGLGNDIRLLATASLGLSVVIVTQFVQVGSPPLEYPLDRSLYLFAFCIPVLATSLFLDNVIRNASGWFGTRVTRVLSFVVGVADATFFLGLAMVFAYFSLAAALLFVVLSCLGSAVSFFYIFRIAQTSAGGSLAYIVPVIVLLLAVFLLALGPERAQLNDAWVLTYVPFF
jgi:hypothetical protein